MNCQALEVFDTPSLWTPVVSGRAALELIGGRGPRGPALGLRTDFRGEGGFVVARRSYAQDIPARYVLRLAVRVEGPPNCLEIKLLDSSGRNVWRHVRPDLGHGDDWLELVIPSRAIAFAWGPASGGRLRALGAIEFAWVAQAGGAGTLWLADLRIEDHSTLPAPALRSSSGEQPAAALTDDGWSPAADDEHPWLELRWSEPPGIGGLRLHWLGCPPAHGFRVYGMNAQGQTTLRYSASVAADSGNEVYLPEALDDHGLRIECQGPFGGLQLGLEDEEFARSIDTFWYALAARQPRGDLPRWTLREQCLWTPVGAGDGSGCALLGEDGSFEAEAGSALLMPMVWSEGRLMRWADVQLEPSLPEGWQPSPRVCWQGEDWRLVVQAEALDGGAVRLRYRLHNDGPDLRSFRLFAVLLPFQLTPPWQNLRKLGGVARLHQLSREGQVLLVNGERLLECEQAADGFGAASFDAGGVLPALHAGTLPAQAQVDDPFGFASAALRYDIELHRGESAERSWLARRNARKVGAPVDWPARLQAGTWSASGDAHTALAAMHTAACQVLITRGGDALQPGPRRYSRSWIRDGAIMGAALLRMGAEAEVRAYLRWYLPWQREDGYVPCVVDAEGADPLVEHDSHGQLVALIADHYRFARDAAFLDECWDAVVRALGYVERTLDHTGLMPISASHEGYLAQPVHAFWDDFWTLRGLRDGVMLAGVRGDHGKARRWTELADALATATARAIAETCAERGLDFLPGSVEWADLDPTATANAITLLDLCAPQRSTLPGSQPLPAANGQDLLRGTFRHFLTGWRARRSGQEDWFNYTPYEIRSIAAMLRLGDAAAAQELLRFYLSDRRPLAWNQWPEIAWKDARAPAHIGDVPHTWIAAEYVLAVRSLFVYDSEAEDALVLGAGIDLEWLEGEGLSLEQVPTERGLLSLRLWQPQPDGLCADIQLGPGVAVLLRLPLTAPVRALRVNGSPCPPEQAQSLRLERFPSRVEFTLASADPNAQ